MRHTTRNCYYNIVIANHGFSFSFHSGHNNPCRTAITAIHNFSILFNSINVNTLYGHYNISELSKDQRISYYQYFYMHNYVLFNLR